MALRVFVSFLLLQIACSQRAYSIVNGQPDFCGFTTCPLFKAVKSNSTLYEIREYGPERWIATDMLNRPLVFSTKKAMFMPLHKYVSSNMIPTSSPLLLKSYRKTKKFTMMVYVPKYYSVSLPNSRDVYVTQKQGFTAYVRHGKIIAKMFGRSFSGNPNSNKRWEYEVLILKDALIKDNVTFHHDAFYSVIYDQPWLSWTAHNEVWFIGSE